MTVYCAAVRIDGRVAGAEHDVALPATLKGAANVYEDVDTGAAEPVDNGVRLGSERIRA